MITAIATTEGSIHSNIRCSDVESGHMVIDKSPRSLGLLKGKGLDILWGCLLFVDHGLYHRWAAVWVRNEVEYRELVRIMIGKSTLYDTYVTSEELLHGSFLQGYYSGKLRAGLKDMNGLLICNSLTREQMQYGYYAKTQIIPKKYTYKRPTENFIIEQKMDVRDDELKSFVRRMRGMAKKRGDKYIKRLEYELKVVGDIGVISYFVMVDKIIQKIYKDGQYFSAGRGSVGGALISYLMGVSRFDPIGDHHILPMFERFINPHRVGLPDIDIDVPTDYRPSLIKYIGDTMGQTYRITSIMTLADRGCDELAEQMDVDVDEYKRVNYGLSKTLSMHAAGLIVTDDAIPYYIVDGIKVCDYTKNTCELFGLIKIDLLGLSNLCFIRDCVADIQMDEDEIQGMYDDDDLDVVESMRGDTIGVFQFSSPKSVKVVNTVAPTEYRQLIDLNVLTLAPFVASNVHEAYKDAEDINTSDVKFGNTNGLLLYQDQVLEYAVDYMGMPFNDADKLRKYISKAMIYKSDLEALISKYDDGTHADVIAGFQSLASYTWNVSHAMGYSRLTYVNLYIRHYYPLVFYANVLNLEHKEAHLLNRIMRELRRREINIKYSCVDNYSFRCVAADDYIIIGICMIKGINENKEGYYNELMAGVNSFDQFMEAVDRRICNRAIIKKLIIWKFFKDAKIDRKKTWNEVFFQLRIFKLIRFDLWSEGAMGENEAYIFTVNHMVRLALYVVEYGNTRFQRANFFKSSMGLSSGDVVRIEHGRISEHRPFPRPFVYEDDITPPPSAR